MVYRVRTGAARISDPRRSGQENPPFVEDDEDSEGACPPAMPSDPVRAGPVSGASFGGFPERRAEAQEARSCSGAPAGADARAAVVPGPPSEAGCAAGPPPAGRGSFGHLPAGQRGGVAIEVAFSSFVLVLAFAGLMGIVFQVYESDRTDRAARAAARAVALLADAPATTAALEAVACRAIRTELGLAATFDCGTEWTFAIDAFENPAALLAGTPRTGSDAVIGGEDGDMVRVRIAALVEAAGDSDGDDADGGDGDADADADGGVTVPLDVLAEAVARNERAG